MNYSFSISTKLGDEYRIILLDADISVLGEKAKYSHQVSGIDNTPIIIRGKGYTQYMHLIARSKHRMVVELIKDDVLEGWGK